MLQATETKPKLAYSVNELSEQTTLSKAFLRNEIRAGNLRARRIERRVLIMSAEAERYLKGEK